MEIAGRYRTVRKIGSGGGGEVFEATELSTGRTVAIKRLWANGSRREQREIAAMRLLRTPGVVSLFDEIEQDGNTWLVMEYVDGQPFPGRELVGRPQDRWNAIAETVAALLLTLEYIHEQGLVHRDLKPGNILVDESGRPVILDFGLVRGSALGATTTRSGDMVGTPLYLAPEQIFGGRVDRRADLYAVGAILYELLVGRPPFPDTSWLAKATHDPPPVSEACPQLDPIVGRTIDRMLTRLPSARPASAEEVRHTLFGGPQQELPWLGSREPIEQLIQAIRERRSIRIAAKPGHGLSRLVREASRVLGAGCSIVVAESSARPYGSLAFTEAGDPDAILERVRSHFEAGHAILVPSAKAIDRWTRRHLMTVTSGAVLWGDVGAENADIHLRPLKDIELRPLFHGPEPFLHIPEDAAALLRQRTGGVPALILRELDRWLIEGASWTEHHTLQVTRSLLDRMLVSPVMRPPPVREIDLEPELADMLRWVEFASPNATPGVLARALERPEWEVKLELEELVSVGAMEMDPDGHAWCLARARDTNLWDVGRTVAAHQALARALEPGTKRRLLHICAGGLTELIADEALLTAEALQAAGRSRAAIAILLGVLENLEQCPEPQGLVLDALLFLALEAGSRSEGQQVLAAITRAAEPDRERELLAQAVLHLLTGEWLDAAACLDQCTPNQAQRALLLWTLRVRLARRGPRKHLEEAVAAACEWAQGRPVEHEVAVWRGHLQFAEQNYPAARASYERAANLVKAPIQQLTHGLAATRAALAYGDFAAASDLAARARQVAVSLRHPHLEARALLYERSARVRGARDTPPQPELVEQMRPLDAPYLTGTLASAESWAAYHTGDAKLASRLAEVAMEQLLSAGVPEGAYHAQAMVLACSPSPAVDAVAQVFQALQGCRLPDVALDGMALLVHAGHGTPRIHAELRRRLDEWPDDTRAVRLGVFSPDEISSLLE